MSHSSLSIESLQSEWPLSHGTVVAADAMEALPQFPSNSVSAIVTDPPYNYDDGFMQSGWDDIGSATEYQEWCETWAERCRRVLKPGGHIIAFSSNRSHHRLMAGVEDAGYEIRDTITWHYATGLPKAPKIARWLSDEDAAEFGDWRGLLKPTTEFAVLARAPLDGRSSTKNQMKHGTGNLNVEACRINVEGTRPAREETGDVSRDRTYQDDEGGSRATGETDEGRFPANLILDSVMADVMDGQSSDGGRGASDVSPVGGGASRFFYTSKAATSERTHDGAVENDHPTVKPRKLMSWLVKLVTAEGQRVLDPFSGSGTTLLAAGDCNRIGIGIEKSKEYASTARDRLMAAGQIE